MKKTKYEYYCDVCGKKLEKPYVRRMPILLTFLIYLLFTQVYIEDIMKGNNICCKECFFSFKKWIKYRVEQ
jgi:DNA-directed RNA polymerase subunit RPC12/RpoP